MTSCDTQAGHSAVLAACKKCISDNIKATRTPSYLPILVKSALPCRLVVPKKRREFAHFGGNFLNGNYVDVWILAFLTKLPLLTLHWGSNSHCFL